MNMYITWVRLQRTKQFDLPQKVYTLWETFFNKNWMDSILSISKTNPSKTERFWLWMNLRAIRRTETDRNKNLNREAWTHIKVNLIRFARKTQFLWDKEPQHFTFEFVANLEFLAKMIKAEMQSINATRKRKNLKKTTSHLFQHP